MWQSPARMWQRAQPQVPHLLQGQQEPRRPARLGTTAWLLHWIDLKIEGMPTFGSPIYAR